MHSLTLSIFLYILICTKSQNVSGPNDVDSVTLNNVIDRIVSLLGVTHDNENKRVKELKEKLNKIETYVVDKEKYAELLLNETRENSLNETNFFKALNDFDEFQYLKNNETKSLYLKLKEKMTRDDILNIIATSSRNSKLGKSARKVMGDDFFNGGDSERRIDDVIDKIIAEVPRDNHKYDPEDIKGIYWDPQRELEERREYHKHDGRRIYKGERTTVRHYPFMVSVQVMGRFWCGGVIYWHDLVLTSAACLQLLHNNRFFRENPRVLQVRVGSNHSKVGGEMIDALEVYFHPSYNPRTLRNNIAVIRLRRHLYFNYHRIPKCIEISHVADGVAPTVEVLLLGWGVTKISQKLAFEPVYLQRKFLPVYPNAFCKEVYGDNFITQTMFCAGTMTTGEGACDHDAGGPAILAGKLVGIISFGPSVCGYPNAPTVFTLVGAYSDWIETVNETMPQYHRGKKRTTTTTPTSLFTYHYELKQDPAASVTPYWTPNTSPTLEQDHATVSPTTGTQQTAPTERTTTTPAPAPAMALRNKDSDDDTEGGDGWSIDM